MGILKVEGLTKKYGKGESEIIALDNVSFCVNKGEFVAIVGSSGSGKSTLLHMLGGVDLPTLGQVYIDDTDIYSLDENELAILRRRKVGFVFQFYNLIPVLTAKENIELPVLLDNKTPDRKYINELFEILALNDRRQHLPSGGQAVVQFGYLLVE